MMKGQSLGPGATSPRLRCGHVTAPLSPALRVSAVWLSCAGPWSTCLSRGHSFDPHGCLGRQALSPVCREEAGTGNVAVRAPCVGVPGPGLAASLVAFQAAGTEHSSQGSLPVWKCLEEERAGERSARWPLGPVLAAASSGRGVAPAAPCA